MPRPSQNRLEKTAARLPEAEMDVMALVWRLGHVTTRQVCQALAPRRTMGQAAAQTLLLRLEAKGLVKRAKLPGKNAYRYSPTRSPEPAYRRLSQQLLDRLFAGSTVKLMASLFATRRPTTHEIHQLEQLLKTLKK